MFYKIVVNPTFKTRETMYDNRVVVLPPMGYLQVQPEVAKAIERDFKKMGIFVFDENRNNLRAQQQEALNRYLVEGLYDSRYCWERWMDGMKLAGVNINYPREYKALLHEIDQVEQEINKITPEEKLPTFADFKPLELEVKDETHRKFREQWEASLSGMRESMQEKKLNTDEEIAPKRTRQKKSPIEQDNAEIESAVKELA